ncbi:hypothetical protein [Glutamicibacter sp. TV12E]|uniref:hypothetical protein n=1 Tax=Glutamicibacter sp. TV12E TaxID=3446362 RepID=UPI0040343F88
MTTTKCISMTGQTVLSGEHEHSWEIQSSHNTSTGIVHYLQCRQCKTHQMRQLGFSQEATLSSKEVRA